MGVKEEVMSGSVSGSDDNDDDDGADDDDGFLGPTHLSQLLGVLQVRSPKRAPSTISQTSSDVGFGV